MRGVEPRSAEAKVNRAKGWANPVAKDHKNRLPIWLSIKLPQRGEDYQMTGWMNGEELSEGRCVA